MSEAKKCPKCGGEMVQGEFLKNLPKVIVSAKKGRRRFDKAIPNLLQEVRIHGNLQGNEGRERLERLSRT